MILSSTGEDGMRPILRSFLAVLLGAIAAGLLIFTVELLGTKLFPFPPGTDVNNPDALRAAMSHIPTGALLLVLFGWIVGTFVGAWVAARVAGRAPIAHGLVIGVLFLAAAVANMLAIPHPVWFWVLGVAVFLPAAYLGARVGKGGR
jgi:hypothetical protein